MKDFKAPEEASSSLGRTFSFSNHDSFSFLWVIFAIQNPDQDFQSGPGS